MNRIKKPPKHFVDYDVGDDSSNTDLDDNIFETKINSKAKKKKRSAQTPAETAKLTAIDSSARSKKRYITCLFIPSFSN